MIALPGVAVRLFAAGPVFVVVLLVPSGGPAGRAVVGDSVLPVAADDFVLPAVVQLVASVFPVLADSVVLPGPVPVADGSAGPLFVAAGVVGLHVLAAGGFFLLAVVALVVFAVLVAAVAGDSAGPAVAAGVVLSGDLVGRGPDLAVYLRVWVCPAFLFLTEDAYRPADLVVANRLEAPAPKVQL